MLLDANKDTAYSIYANTCTFTHAAAAAVGEVRAANEVADIVALLWQRRAGVVCTQAPE